MTYSSEVHDNSTLLVNFWSKLYSKSIFPNKWYHSSPRFPLHCAINNLQLNILMICFPYMIHDVCKVAGTMSFYKRTILKIYKFDKTYSFIKLCWYPHSDKLCWYPQIGKVCWYPHANKLLQKCVIFNKAINLHSRGPTEQYFYVWEASSWVPP